MVKIIENFETKAKKICQEMGTPYMSFQRLAVATLLRKLGYEIHYDELKEEKVSG